MVCQAAKTIIMSSKSVTKVVWYILVQLKSLDNGLSLEGWEARRPESLESLALSSLPASQHYSLLAYLPFLNPNALHLKQNRVL